MTRAVANAREVIRVYEETKTAVLDADLAKLLSLISSNMTDEQCALLVAIMLKVSSRSGLTEGFNSGVHLPSSMRLAYCRVHRDALRDRLLSMTPVRLGADPTSNMHAPKAAS